MSVRKLFELKGRVALITGGSRGLGLQMAEALGEMGAKVAITARKQDELDEAQRHLEAEGVEVMTIACDMQDLKAAQALPGQVLARWKRIDVLVNNAGTTWGAPAEEHPLEAWHKVINLNLNAVFALTQAVGSSGDDSCAATAASSISRPSRDCRERTHASCAPSPTTPARPAW